MQQDYKVNEQKINNLLDEINSDREKIFTDIKTSKDIEKIKETKVKSLENLIKSLLHYKNLLIREKEKKDE
jgi:hypothetical protein